MTPCHVAPLLGRHGRAPSQAEVLARLTAGLATSPQTNPVLRTADMAASLVRWRKRIDVVVLHVFSGRAFLTADAVSRLARALKLPVVMALHGGGLPEFRQAHPDRVERVLERATRLVAPSPFLAREFQHLGIPIDVIPNVVELGDYDYRPRTSAAPTLLWMRAFSDVYRPGLAVETLASLRKQHPDATLTMAGQPGPLLPPTKDLAARLGVAGAVTFAGFLDADAKRKALADHDVFLVTTSVDNAPVSVIEAAAAGLPVVACNVGGLADLLDHEQTGLLVDDPADLPAAVHRLLEDDALAHRLSVNGRQLAERFDWPAVRGQWDALYDTVAS